MVRKSLVAAGLLAASVSTASAAPYGFFDARSVAMGNTSVATGGLTTAAFANPAMLAINESDESFALLIPAVGVQVIENGDMIDLIDQYQALISGPVNSTTVQEMIDVTNQLDSTSLIANANANAALITAFDDFTVSAAFRGYGQASGGIIITTAGDVGTLTSPEGQLDALGYAAQEISVSIASKFKFAGMKFAWGVTPKVVTLDAIEYNQQLTVADTVDIATESGESLGSFTTVDAGLVIQIFDHLSAGIVAKNLIEESKVTTLGNELNFNTQLRAGVAFHSDWVTIAADMDLAENDPISPTSYEDPSQMMTVGAEFDVLDILQLRAGYQTNIASGADEPDLLSAGVGLWLGFNLDIAAVVAEDSSLGVFVQTGFRF